MIGATTPQARYGPHVPDDVQRRPSGMRSIDAHAVGLGLRIPHYEYLFEQWPAVGYFEIISENFMGPALPPRLKLDRVRARYPIVLHGVGLNLLGHAPLDDAY